MSRKIAEEIAEIISLLLNAPLLAAAAFLLLLLLVKVSNIIEVGAITIFFGTFVPLVLVYYLSKRGIIPDYYASEQQTRRIPLIGAMLSYLAGAALLFLAQAPALIIALMLCYVVNTLIMMLISLKWKISIHASGVTGPATFLMSVLGLIALPFLALVIPVGWARLRLQAHTPSQVLAGALLTIALTWIQVRAFLAIL